MANTASTQGQLQRSGVRRLFVGKKKKKLVASRIRESSGNPFVEQGQDEKQKGKKGEQKGRVYLVTIIEEGLGNNKDKNYYSGEALKQGINVFNGSKAYADHPDAISEKTLPERSMKDLVGWYSDCFTDSNPATGRVRLRGKLHFFPSAKWLTDMIDTILSDPSAKNLFGISINAIGKTRPATMQGEQVNYVEDFQRVDSADVVTEPAARGKFDQMLESRRPKLKRSTHVEVSRSVKRRARESGVLSSEKAKEVADSLVSAYNSDNPDEAKTAMFEAAKVLHAASSISGKGPGQVNEEQFSNINPSGGEQPMAGKVKVKASGRRPLRFRKKKALRAAAGTGPDNEDVGEPNPSDIPGELEEADEADVEDEEGRGDLGSQADFGGGSKYRSVKASGKKRRVRAATEDEGLEDEDEDEAFEDESIEGLEDEGLEDEDEDEDGMGALPGAGAAAPAGGGAPGSSRTVTSAEADFDDEGDDEEGDEEDDWGDMDESVEDEHDMMRPSTVSEARGRRGTRGARRRSQEADASLSGGLGRSGNKSLPKGADPTKGYTDRDEDFGSSDDSTSGVGKSYQLKTSKFRKNRLAKRVAHEANRRIAILEDNLTRLRESGKAKDRKIDRYKGIMRFAESRRSGVRLLREAVKKELFPVGVAEDLLPRLLGMNRDDQIREIRITARLLESATEGAVVRMTESVDGNGARGGVASHFGTAGADDSELAEAFAGDGVPMKKEK